MWSKTFGAWYVPYSKQALLQVKENFEGIANLDATVLKAKLLKVRNTPAFIRNHVLSEDKILALVNLRDGYAHAGIVNVPLQLISMLCRLF